MKKIILLSVTNKLQHYTTFFIIANAVHVSDGFSAHHHMPDTVCTVFELLMMGGETAWNM